MNTKVYDRAEEEGDVEVPCPFDTSLDFVLDPLLLLRGEIPGDLVSEVSSKQRLRSMTRSRVKVRKLRAWGLWRDEEKLGVACKRAELS